MTRTLGLAQDPAVHRVPLEIWEAIFAYMEPHEIVRVRQTMRAMFVAGVSAALWRPLFLERAQHAPLDAPAHAIHSVTTMERALLVREKLDRAWTTRGAHPDRVIRFRAHVNRITSLRLLVGTPSLQDDAQETPCWLLTGSVDGYVRVWDVRRALQQRGEFHVTPELAVDALHRSTSNESACDDDESTSSLPTDPAHDIKRSARAFLVAEVDTGGDVTSLDAQLDPDRRILTMAVGSYYSTAGALLYELRLCSLPHLLDMCGSLDPPEWGGTQCVSLRDEVVGRVYLLHWRSGERAALEQLERGSIAALALLDRHVVAVSRMGHITLYERRGPVHAVLTGQHTVGQHPLLSAALGRQDGRCFNAADTACALPLLCVDPTGLAHWLIDCTQPTVPPRLVAHHEVPERLIGASVGATGHHALLASSLGGVPPICATRLYTQDAPLVPIRPTPDIVLPNDTLPAPGLPPAPAGATPPSPTPSRPRSVRVDSFSSTSTASSAGPSPSSRVDMLTETAIDESRGLLCLASVRGAVWIADYGGPIDTL